MRRRDMLAGVLAVILAGGAAWKFHLFGKHYPATPYDDLLGQIPDREPAAQLGRAALKAMPGATAASLALMLRRDGRNLATRAAAEPSQAQVVEVAGWVVPQSVALYAALAARV